MAEVKQSAKFVGFKYLKKEFDKYFTDNYTVADIYLAESIIYDQLSDYSGEPSSLYFANGSFNTKLRSSIYNRKLIVKPEHKDKFIFEFLSIYLTVYANHYIKKIDSVLERLKIYEDDNDSYFKFYQQISIPYLTIEEQKSIIKMYKIIITECDDPDTDTNADDSD
jgi:hypothetical protein